MPVTVAELIAKLKEMPQDARVVVDGYEGGLTDPPAIYTVPIVCDENGDSWVYGPHEKWSQSSSSPADEVAVHISRYDKDDPYIDC